MNEKVACNTTLSIITIEKSSRQCIWSALQGNQISWNNTLYTVPLAIAPCNKGLKGETKKHTKSTKRSQSNNHNHNQNDKKKNKNKTETRNKSDKMTTIVVNTNHTNTLVLGCLCSASRSPQCCALRQKPTCCFVRRRCPCWASHCPRWQSCEPANN